MKLLFGTWVRTEDMFSSKQLGRKLESLAYLVMTQFKKVSPKVDCNAAEKVDKCSNNPLSHW